MYDIIGDIHGHADELVELLEQLGYREVGGRFRHRSRQVVFCGDFIDRGPQIRDTLRIVRSTVECDAALAVMGNHEFNAIAFRMPRSDEPGEYYRRHSERNLVQHRATLEQLTSEELEDAVAWFATLPVALDLGMARVVHACWSPSAIARLNQTRQTQPADSEAFVRAATTPGDPLFEAVECVLKGPELKLPEGVVVHDKDGATRTRTRIRWYESPGRKSWSEYCLPGKTHPVLESLTVPRDCPCVPYPATDPPVFFGHYWLSANRPAPLAPNVACLDYSVARGGMLCAYRHDRGRPLTPRRFVSVRSRDNRTAAPLSES